jgi:hypothetical protein
MNYLPENGMKILLALHIIGGSVGVITGFTSLFAGKGTRLHRYSGIVFVGAMIMLGLSGAVIGAAKGQTGNIMAGLMATYLVVTGLTAVRPVARNIDVGGMILAAIIGFTNLGFGIYFASQGKLVVKGVPVPMIFFIATITLLAAYGDLKILRLVRSRGAHELPGTFGACASRFSLRRAHFSVSGAESPLFFRISCWGCPCA